MTKKDNREKLIDYLYDEMGERQKEKFEELLSQSPELRKELEEIRSTRNLLREEPGNVPHKSLLLLQPESERDSGNDRSPRAFFYLKSAASVAAAVLLTLLVLSFVNLQVNQTEQGFLISFGDEPVPAEAAPEIDKQEVYDLITELQQENTRVFATILEQNRREHQQQMEDIIETLVQYYNERRQQDLMLISQGLAQLEEETYYRFLQTEEALEDLIFALSYQQTVE